MLAEKQLAAIGFFFARSLEHSLVPLLLGVSSVLGFTVEENEALFSVSWFFFRRLPLNDRSSMTPSNWFARFRFHATRPATTFLPTFVPLVPGFGTFTETRPLSLERVLAMAHTNDQKIRSSGSISD